MVAFPHCKINIGLRIVGKRADGFHDIETIFYPIGLKDVIEILEQPAGIDAITYTRYGIPIPGTLADDLCVKAWHLLKKDFPSLPVVNMQLLKAIPLGAGLGGGSADAAFMLKLLNSYFGLNIQEAEMLRYALSLGSDCPFFIKNGPCYATGRGELLEEIKIDLSMYSILLVNPGIHINTGWAFSNISITKNLVDLKALVQLPVDQWQHNIINDFEVPVFAAYPEIASINDSLIRNGALYAAMTGSGSTVFGIFNKGKTLTEKFPEHYFCKWI